jgi:hypothetical protein
MPESSVDDRICRLGASPQGVRITEIATMRRRPHRQEAVGGSDRACEAQNLMAICD